MSRRWLGLALLLSLGINLGIVAVLLVERTRPAARAPAAAPAGTPAEGLPGPPPGTESPFPGRADLGPIADGGGEDRADRPERERPLFPGAAEALERGELPPGVAWRLGALADRLGITGNDREHFLEIQRRFFVESHQRRGRIFGLQERFRHALADPNPSHDTIDALIRQLGEERAGFDTDLARTVLETRKLLGPGHERQYLELIGRLGPRPGGDAQPGPPGRPGPPLRRRR